MCGPSDDRLRRIMHRIAVSICASSFMVSALTLAACTPETVPAQSSTVSSQSTPPAARSASGSNAQVNEVPPRMDPPFVMREAAGSASQVGEAATMQPAQVDAGQAKQAHQQVDASLPAPQMDAATDAGNAECTMLSTCCAALTDEDDREDCEEVVQRNDAERCARASDRACQARETTAEMPGESCSTLSTCCATLPRPPQQQDCQRDAMRADEERCTRQLLRTCPELGPPPREPACVSLQACCPTLTEPRALELCRRALREDEQRDCLEASMALCQ